MIDEGQNKIKRPRQFDKRSELWSHHVIEAQDNNKSTSINGSAPTTYLFIAPKDTDFTEFMTPQIVLKCVVLANQIQN